MRLRNTVGDVQGRCGHYCTSTAGEEVVNDDRTQVVPDRKGAGLGVERDDGPSFGGLSFATIIVTLVTDVGGSDVGTAGGVVALDHHSWRLGASLVDSER